jgi:SET domain-containing protein
MDEKTGKINQVASRDIKAGEELTCNYLHFDLDCDGHQFKC